MTATLTPTSRTGCPPRWATPRDLSRSTLGGRVAEIAALLGTPLMPWQRLVADVAMEVDPDTDLLAYREVDLTVPRQSGKTTLLLAEMVHRARAWTRQRIVYTAQDRMSARKKWEDEHLVTLQASPLRNQFTPRKQLGQEAFRWRNGSLHELTAPSANAAHGEVLDLGVIDEAWAREDARVEQGMKPAMITRPQPQLWVPSTAGTARSVYLREKVDAGRLQVDAGVRGPVAYFEWSAPADADPADPATWWGCMPALGWTVSEAAIRAEYETWSARGKLAEFRRAYLNQWPDDTPDEWQVIPQGAWRWLADPSSQLVNPVAFAVDATPDRTWVSVGAAGRRSDGLLHVEVVDHRRGTGWVVPRMVELQARWTPCAVAVSPTGPASSLIPDLEAVGVVLVKPSARDDARACGAFYDATGANPKVEDPAWLRHLDQPELAAALAGARRREFGDVWYWARKGLSVDISPLVAVTQAAWAHATYAHQAAGERIPEPDIF